ncbi:MAG TPA: gluconate 2-dehydrogenase subunit 3 family protein [Rhodanobacteraceae bacterium]|nr:gluconate 2-dehydrogenase subunit 3 family protein [Rhodanobacteraceae bacterium]
MARDTLRKRLARQYGKKRAALAPQRKESAMAPLTSRRRLLQAAALAVPAAALLGCRESRPIEDRDDFGGVNPGLANTHSALAGGNSDEVLFLSEAERSFLQAATDRLIPGDAKSPGARQANVTVFIDRQLSGPFGQARTWYMNGPWSEGTKEQGYQSKLSPAEMYRAAIAEIEQHCEQKYHKRFAQLDSGEQDNLLHALENGELDLAHAPAGDFFTLLLQNTQEGFLADPMYGGNRDFAGWNLIGFPGPRYNYVDEIAQYGKRYALPTVGLQGRARSRVREG